MTALQDVRGTLGQSEPAAWIPFSEMGTWTFRDDVQLRIQRHEQLDPEFEAPWTRNVQGSTQTYGYLVYYGNSPVEYHTIAGVDSFRAHIPLPRQPSDPNQPYTITPYQATVGRIITGNAKTFEAYLDTTGIQVQRPD